MKMIKSGSFGLLLMVGALCSACKKDWLDAKPSKALVVPTAIADYQALLDNSGLMNINQPGISLAGDGDYAVTDAVYNGLRYQAEKGAYIWAATDDFYGGQASSDWVSAYTRILQDNIALAGIPALPTTAATQAASDNVKGSALFYRSFDFYNLAQQYCKAYNSPTAGTDLGLPLRLAANVNLAVNRSSVQQTYDQLINDLQQAAPLLPVIPLFPTRPSKPAVYGLLSRVYLAQENYSKALNYADSCLQLKSALMDFNQLLPASTNPTDLFNKEVIFHSVLASYQSDTPPNLIVDPALYQSYGANDLRAAIYFLNSSGVMTVHSSYAGNSFNLFGGLATDEIYLIRAECYARAGNLTAAMNDLNTLLQTRWKTGTYTPVTAAGADAALALILTERRKELCFRNLRWTDLRRLNKDPRFQVTLTRTVNGQTYTLPPNSPRYVLPLDPVEILTGGLPQNPR